MTAATLAASRPAPTGILSRDTAILVFAAFALAYFLSALVRAVTATLSPTLSAEFGLNASDLGLLAGGYFLGFAATQLPLGKWLDRYGPKKVIVAFLAVAVLGCMAFAWASSFYGLLLARIVTGAGVSACLMAPLTGYRRWFLPGAQLRANSWMLMTGSFGMVAATLPVQWLMPLLGWRGLFWVLAVAILLSMVVIAWAVPRWKTDAEINPTSATTSATTTASPPKPDTASHTADQGYASIWRNRYFRRMAGLGFFNYGGMVAVQTLWAGPWMVRVAGYSPGEAATGLFLINGSMLCTFWLWGIVNPRLVQRGIRVETLIQWGLPISFVVLASNIVLGTGTGWLGWALFCVSSTFVSLSQPAVGMAFPSHMAGRALSAFNLVIFSGVFVVQWGIGLLVDAFGRLGWSEIATYQGAMGVFLATCLLAYGYFLYARADNPSS